MIRLHALVVFALLAGPVVAAPAATSRRVVDGQIRYSVSLRGTGPELARRLSTLTGMRVFIAADAPGSLRLEASDVGAETLFFRLADQNRLFLIPSDGAFILQRREPTVTLDVKDETVRTVLRSVQRQCGIRNLMIDPEVQVSGTFLLTDVPCSAALDVITRSLGLTATGASTAMTRVSSRR